MAIARYVIFNKYTLIIPSVTLLGFSPKSLSKHSRAISNNFSSGSPPKIALAHKLQAQKLPCKFTF